MVRVVQSLASWLGMGRGLRAVANAGQRGLLSKTQRVQAGAVSLLALPEGPSLAAASTPPPPRPHPHARMTTLPGR